MTFKTASSQVNEIKNLVAAELDWATLMARNRLKCPKCRSIVYSRKSRRCGVCSMPLPESYAFSDKESRWIEQALQREKSQHRQWMARRSALAA